MPAKHALLLACHDRMEDGVACVCPEQLWNFPAIGAAWTESMQLGSAMHTPALQDFCKDLEHKNVQLGNELSITMLQLHIAREDLEKVRAANHDLQRRVDEAEVELALLRKAREERMEQEQLAADIWGPVMKPRPDATWDPPPTLLASEGKRGAHPLWTTGTRDQPLTVGKVAADLGYQCTAQHIHRLGTHVREAFMRANGRAPEPIVFYDRDGMPERVSCFVERDRPLIETVVRKHGELAG